MREFKDRVQDTTQTTGTGPFTLDSATIAGFRTFGAAHASGASFEYFTGLGAEWEVGVGTLTGTSLSRSPLASSNGGNLVNFSAGSKTIFETVSAAQIARSLTAQDVVFSDAIPLTTPGSTYMAQKNVAGGLTFTPAASAVRGALVYLRLIADGSNAPNFSAFKEWGGSSGYDNRNGIANQIQFFYDGYDYWYSASQAVGAVPVPAAASALTFSGPSSGVINTASSNFTVGTDGVRSAAVVVTPTPITGVTFSPTSITLPAGTGTGTFTATSTTTGAKSVAVTNNAGLTNPTAVTWTVAAAATAPAQMAAPTATAGDTTASVTGVAPSDGGSPITGYTVTSSPAGMVDSNAGSTSLTHAMTGGTNGAAYTFTMIATNAVGTSPVSPASNSVTLAAAAVSIRLSQLVKVTESGSGPYAYTSVGNAAGYASGAPGPGGVASVHFSVNTDGSFAFQMGNYTAHGEPILGLSATNALLAFNQLPYALYGATVGAAYKQITSGTIGAATATVAPLSGDILRLRRVGTSLIAEVARSGTPTAFTTVYTWTGVPTTAFYVNAMLGGDIGETPATISNFSGVGLV